MDTKLTLSLDKNVIKKAKAYAREKQVSLSFLVENYFQKLVSEYKPASKSASKAQDSGSIVDTLSGIVKLDPDYDYKEAYSAYSSKKYK